MPCRICKSADSRTLYDLPGWQVIQCLTCRFVYIPANEFEAATVYDTEHYSGDPYFAFGDGNTPHPLVLEDFCEVLQTLVRLNPHRGNLLDVGCATGHFLKMAHDDGWTPFGIEISQRLARLAQEKLGLIVHVGQLSDIDLPSSSFQAVTFLDTLEHLAEPLSALIQSNYFLKPGGLLVVAVPRQDALVNQVAHVIYTLTGGRMNFPMIGLYPYPRHLNYFTLTTLTYALRQAGFNIVSTKAHGRMTDTTVRGPFMLLTIKILFLLAGLLGRENKLMVYAQKVSDPE